VPSAPLPTVKDVWAIAWPMITAYISVPLMGLASVAVMGHLDDTRYLGGVGLATNFFSFFYFVFAFIRWSTTGLAAQATGRARRTGDTRELRDILLRSIGIGAVLGGLLVLLRTPLLSLVMGLLTPSTVLQGEAHRYADWRIFGAPALLATYAMNGWFIGSGQPRAVLRMTLVANGVNVLLLLLFVQGWGWRSAGAGVATALAEWAGLLTGLVEVKRSGGVRWRGLLFSHLVQRAALVELFAANANVLVKTLFTIAVFFGFLGISGRLDPVALAANLVLLQLFYFISYALEGFANACSAISGQAQGSGNIGAVQRALTLCHRCALGTGSFFAVVVLVGGHHFVGWMSSLPGVVGRADHFMGWLAVVAVVLAGPSVYDGFFIGTVQLGALRNTAVAGAVSFGLMCWVGLPLLGNHGLWLAFAGHFVVRQGVATAQHRRARRPQPVAEVGALRSPLESGSQ